MCPGAATTRISQPASVSTSPGPSRPRPGRAGGRPHPSAAAPGLRPAPAPRSARPAGLPPPAWSGMPVGEQDPADPLPGRRGQIPATRPRCASSSGPGYHHHRRPSAPGARRPARCWSRSGSWVPGSGPARSGLARCLTLSTGSGVAVREMPAAPRSPCFPGHSASQVIVLPKTFAPSGTENPTRHPAGPDVPALASRHQAALTGETPGPAGRSCRRASPVSATAGRAGRTSGRACSAASSSA